jgi:hypothetical protein
VRLCFAYWRFFAMRNVRMRGAWLAAARWQLDLALRASMSAFKANWRASKREREQRLAVLTAWRRLARRNLQVRRAPAGCACTA